MRSGVRAAAVAALFMLAVSMVTAQAGESSPGASPDDLHGKIDAVAAEVLESTGVPSASVAVVIDGRLAHVKAYGDARLEPRMPADVGMRYPIGSISKQFTAAALLLLQEEGKLSLDEPVGKYFPGLARANKVTIRQLLSHTSGYQDHWPQDYVPAMMLEPVSPAAIMERWARAALDFDPGTQWQYSNTGYVIAGAIAEKVLGGSLQGFLEKRIFSPLGMDSAIEFEVEGLGQDDPTGYRSFALGPPRSAPVTAAGWLFAAGALAMTAEDLARWDVSLIEQSVLSAASYRELETETMLANGVGAGYGLGVGVKMTGLRRTIGHGGEVSGFTSMNVVYPDDRAAIVVLTNQDAARAADQITEKIGELIFEEAEAADEAALEKVKGIFAGLQEGRLERSLFTDNANFYFSEEALADFKSGLAPLGAPTGFEHVRHWLRGGMTGRSYDATFGDKTLRVWTYETADGKLEQYQIAVKE